ncbi:MAG: carboxypeptidase-like regulatory domain-containing protein [Cyclobacteriaceae bacterium]
MTYCNLAAQGQWQGSRQARNVGAQGQVFDGKTDAPLIGALVKVKNQRDSIMAATVTDAFGRFALSFPMRRNLTLQVSFIGYQNFNYTFETFQSEFDLGKIKLEEDSKLLDEITITGDAIIGENKGDTASFNASAQSGY